MKALLTAALLLAGYCAFSQKLTDTIVSGNILLRFNPVSLIDVSEPSVSFGAERRMSNKLSLAMDAGYIVYSERFHDLGRSSGFIVRPAIRYFPNRKNIFFEMELHYKQHTHHIQDWVGRAMSGGVPAYEEYREFRLRKQVVGMHLKFGAVMPVTRRLWFELYLGIGPHFRRYTVIDGKDLVYNFNLFAANVRTGETDRLVAIPMGWRVLYRIR